jgi:metalloendopeptidase OMA1, mitochondrial
MKLEKKHACPLAVAPFLVALGFVLFKLFSSSEIVNPETGRTSRISLKPSEENRLGLEAYQQVRRDESKDILQSGEQVDLVQRITRRLAQAAAKKSTIDYQWDVSVIRSNQRNAFCLPGGKIVVYTGIIPIALNEAGLATVLAHEMAHATSRHGAERLFRADLTQTILGGIQGSLAQMDPQQRQVTLSLSLSLFLTPIESIL